MFKKNEKDKKTQEPEIQKAPSAGKPEPAAAAQKPAEEKAAAPEKPAQGARTEEAAKAVKDNFPPDPKDVLEKKLAESELKIAEAANERLRLLAELDNQRKRGIKDMEFTRSSVMTDTLMPFLKVYEHFRMAVSASEKTDNFKSLIQGMKMIENEFGKAFQELGVECEDAVGKEFNPAFHEAIAQQPSETVPAGKVISQWSPCYKSGGRVLKAAMVVVSSGKPQEEKKK